MCFSRDQNYLHKKAKNAAEKSPQPPLPSENQPPKSPSLPPLPKIAKTQPTYQDLASENAILKEKLAAMEKKMSFKDKEIAQIKVKELRDLTGIEGRSQIVWFLLRKLTQVSLDQNSDPKWSQNLLK